MWRQKAPELLSRVRNFGSSAKRRFGSQSPHFFSLFSFAFYVTSFPWVWFYPETHTHTTITHTHTYTHTFALTIPPQLTRTCAHTPHTQMDRIIPNLEIIARCSPEDKLILVKRLRELGDVVAVTGDGTNDRYLTRLFSQYLCVGKFVTDFWHYSRLPQQITSYYNLHAHMHPYARVLSRTHPRTAPHSALPTLVLLWESLELRVSIIPRFLSL